MEKYHKIITVYKRDPDNKHKTLLGGQFAMPEFEYLKDNEWVFTEKIDGTNIRVMWDGEKLHFRGKTDNSQIPIFLVTKLKDIFIPEMFTDFEDGVCLYGEGFGAKIQKGGGNYCSTGVSFILFDVRIGDLWLKWEDVVYIADQMSIDPVPVIDKGCLEYAIDIVKKGFDSVVAEQKRIAEGLVMKPVIELINRRGDRIISKIKYKDFPRN